MAWSSSPTFSEKASGASGPITTTAVDTTGADFIVVTVGWYILSSDYAFSDSKGNTWTPLTQYDNTGITRIYYCVNPTVGSGHTFSVAGSFVFAFLCATGWTGTNATPADQDVGGTDSTPGPITPSVDNSLIISAATFSDGGSYLASGMTVEEFQNYAGGVNFGGAQAYHIQGSAASFGPTWSGGTVSSSAIASFKPSVGGGGATPSGDEYFIITS